MAQTNINIRIDNDLKMKFEEFCNSVGMSMTTAFNIFAIKAVKEQRIPFEITADPFYSEENINRLKNAADDVKKGRNISKHNITEINGE